MTAQVRAEQPASNKPLPKVSVVDDDPDMLAFFKDLADSGRFVLLGAYSNALEALQDVPKRRPDVLFVDFQLPGMCGIECTRRLTTILPSQKIIVITGHPEPPVLVPALRAGAAGFVVKPCTADEIIAATEEVLIEGIALSKTAMPYLRQIVRDLRHSDPNWNLTQRDEQLIACIFQGLSYKEMASALRIGEATVHTHMDHLFEKMGVHSQKEVITRFLRP